VFKLVAYTVYEFSIFFTTIITLIKALPTGSDCCSTDDKWGVVVQGDFHENSKIFLILLQIKLNAKLSIYMDKGHI
jgi:hypothetical protein